jgi:hypothetical protein
MTRRSAAVSPADRSDAHHSARPRGARARTADEDTDGAGELLIPVSLHLSPIRNLLIVDLADDPTYRTLEPQRLREPDGADRVVLLAYRRDGTVELYAPPEASVDASGYEGLGEGLRGIHRAPFTAARFDVTDDGLRLDLAVALPDDRSFELRIHEHLTGGRDRIPALAPVGGTFDDPAFFPFLWLPGLSFVPVRSSEVVVRVDGAARTVPRLPLPIGGRRCLMARYDPEVLVCQLNPDEVTAPTRVPARPTWPPTVGSVGDDGGAVGAVGARDAGDVEVVEVDGKPAVAAVRTGRDGHVCAAVFDPPLPDVRTLAADERRSGTLTLSADGATVLRARYGVERTDDRARLAIAGFGPWRSRHRRPLLAVLFRLPIFRRWPTSYRWDATVELAAGQAVRMRSRWTRRR